MKFSGLIPYALALVALGGVALAQQQPVNTESPPEQLSQPPQSSSPRRLTINVTVVEPEDLKVAEGDEIQPGQLLADRGRERRRLETQKAQLQLAMQRLETATVTLPVPPAQTPAIANPTFLEERAAIDQAKADVDAAERAITSKQQEIEYLAALPNLDPLILEHEQAKLEALKREHTAAVRAYQLAVGKRSTAEYEHSVMVATNVANQNRAVMSYQQQWAEYEQRLRDRDYQLTQTQLQLDEVDHEIATLAVVRSPYAGRIRRVRWLGQEPDGSLRVELTLLVRDGANDSATVPGQLDGVPGGVDGTGHQPESGDSGN